MKTMLYLFSAALALIMLTSCSTPECCGIRGVNIQPCATIKDKKEREECNQKEMNYYQDTGWRYERFDRR